jgi:hypothetical protein
MGAPKLIPNPAKKKIKPKSQKEPPACEAIIIQKTEKPANINPNGIAAKLGSMKGIFTGFPLHKTFSSALRSLPNPDKAITPLVISQVKFKRLVDCYLRCVVYVLARATIFRKNPYERILNNKESKEKSRQRALRAHESISLAS